MPSILLDHHVTEAAMRPSTTPSRHRRSRRQDRADVASVVAAAPVTHQPAVAESSLNPLRARGTSAYLTGIKRIDRTPLDFSDLRDDADYVPEWAHPLTIDEQVADILATVAGAPFVRHEEALATVLAPLAAMLAEVVAP